MRSAIFWMSLPFVLPQALRVRRTAPRFAAAGGATAGVIGGGDDVELLAIGDSIIAGVGASELAQALVGQTAIALSELDEVRVRWQAHGRVGVTTTSFLREHIDRVPESDPDYIVVSLGVNDVTSLTTVRQWRRNLRALFRELRARYPDALIAFAGVPPLGGFPLLPQPLRAVVGLRGRILDDAARDLIEDYDHIIHVPVEFNTLPQKFSADGFHPSESGYREYGQAMARAIMQAVLPVSGTGPDSARSSV